MDCKWCHNPESITKNVKLLYDDKKCIRCGKCAAVCERGVHRFTGTEHLVERNSCNACGKCVDICPTKAVEICGRRVSVKDVLEIVIRDKIFYDVSNGGMTISGGEPLVQKEFTFGLLWGAKSSGIHTILDTNGYWNWKDIEKMLPYIDRFHYDLKIMDDNTHKRYTGVSHSVIVENLKKLSRVGKDVVVAIPLIKGINDSDGNIKAFISFMKALPKAPKVHILPYHSLYISKTRKLGRRCELFSTPSEAVIERVKTMLLSEGIDLYLRGDSQ
jgi:pyruvate formate lyase activating enzyme